MHPNKSKLCCSIRTKQTFGCPVQATCYDISKTLLRALTTYGGRNICLVQHKTWVFLLKKQHNFNLQFRVIFMREQNFQKTLHDKKLHHFFSLHFFFLDQYRYKVTENRLQCLKIIQAACTHETPSQYVLTVINHDLHVSNFWFQGLNYTALCIKRLSLFFFFNVRI